MSRQEKHRDPLFPATTELNKATVVHIQELDSWSCSKCGSTTLKSTDSRYCSKCYKIEAQNSAVAKVSNSNWMELAQDLGLALYERQPEETDIEWNIWTAYRAHYPMRLPTWSELAQETGSAVVTVTRTAHRWSFKVRLQAWARSTDDSMMEERAAAIKDMNAKQLDISQKLLDKLSAAVDAIDPSYMKPNEIASLMKVAAEMERRVVTALPEKVEGTVLDAGSQKMQLTKPEELGDVISILQGAGVLQGLTGTTVGIEQTTRVLIKEGGDDTDM